MRCVIFIDAEGIEKIELEHAASDDPAAVRAFYESWRDKIQKMVAEVTSDVRKK